MKETEKRIAEQARALLERKVENIDAATRSRLNRIRQQALEHARGRRRQWLPAGLVAATAALVLTLAVVLRTSPPPDAEPAPLEDLDLLASSESLDMLADLEFYVWLEGELEKG